MIGEKLSEENRWRNQVRLLSPSDIGRGTQSPKVQGKYLSVPNGNFVHGGRNEDNKFQFFLKKEDLKLQNLLIEKLEVPLGGLGLYEMKAPIRDLEKVT